MIRLVYLLFFCSGFSGLVYQVVWVRVFGNVFGNTIYSASVVVAVFMVGLGVGSWLAGPWSDRRYNAQPESLLRSYGQFEVLIALMGLGVSALLPHLSALSALVSSYSRDANGWYVLSTTSYIARTGIAVVLLTPITLLMGATLTLLIRHLVRSDPQADSWRIATLYGVNTAGAALGCALTDFVLVPAGGLRATQMVAVSLNVVAGLGAWLLARGAGTRYPARARSTKATSRSGGPSQGHLKVAGTYAAREVAFIVFALTFVGFAAMGMEIVWFRHLTILLGGFRAVFSLLLTVILIGIGAGSLLCAFIERRIARPVHWLMGVQALFIAFTLLGLAFVDVNGVEEMRAVAGGAAGGGLAAESGRAGFAQTLAELWFNARPMLLEVAVPALMMGFSFPLANAITQRSESLVGRRAGILYLANTLGAVGGSLAAGFIFLPLLGIQASVTLLMTVAGLAIVPLYLAARTTGDRRLATSDLRLATSDLRPATSDLQLATSDLRLARRAFAGSLLVGGGALAMWVLLPADYVIMRALPSPARNERLVSLHEGLNEVISVTELPGTGRTLVTNGHPMSSTRRLSQRYMRALAHIPLLSIERPASVLVIGFGVGNTMHAATLHPSVQRVEVADLSKDILNYSAYFSDANHNVLHDPRAVVFVNDGRHHLHMQAPGTYDLITLEPPPIGYAGVAALYSREFYELARTRLKAGGYVSQWLPAYQVPAATSLAMIRAFIDVFPQAVLLSGAEADLLLIGANDSGNHIDPVRVASAISSSPAAEADLRRLDLGSVREVVGTFVGSGRTLATATAGTPAVTDDRPIQEYGVLSLLQSGHAVPAAVVELSDVAEWCPGCFAEGRPIAQVHGLDTYLALLDRAYAASPAEVAHARRLAERGRVIEDSAYLGAVVPESSDVHDLLGVSLASQGAIDAAIVEFNEALRLEPDAARPHWHIGRALVSRGVRQEAIQHLRRSVQLDPNNGQAQYDLAIVLLQERQLDEAVEHLRATIRLMPKLVGAYNNLGIALASQGKIDEAISHFQQALALDPGSAETRHNLSIASKAQAH